MNKKNKGKRLSIEIWGKIKQELDKGESISVLARRYKINRHSIYEMGWRKNWFKKKKIGFWQKVRNWLKLT
jgi:Mor family transcriptional regulator